MPLQTIYNYLLLNKVAKIHILEKIESSPNGTRKTDVHVLENEIRHISITPHKSKLQNCKKKKIKLNNTQCVTSNVETARRKHRQCLLNIDTEKNLEELAEQASTYPGIKAKN